MNTDRVIKTATAALALLMLTLSACAPASPTAAPEASETPAPELPTAEPTEVPYEAGLTLAYIPGGAFLMGSQETDTQARPDELPQRSVTLPAYWIYDREVSNQQYRACVEAGACTEPVLTAEGAGSTYDDPVYEHYPVTGVTWQQASAYCANMDARLPTEAEWEKAARGPDGRAYPWGGDEPTCDLTNQAGCHDPAAAVKTGTLVDGQSPYGLDDMAGNVREWTSDWYAENAYQLDGALNPLGPVEGSQRVVRGGGYLDDAQGVRTAARAALDPAASSADLGFRCVAWEQTSAPFCPTTLAGFCQTPGAQTPAADCVPTIAVQEVTTVREPRVTSMDCPKNNRVSFQVDVGVDDASGYSVTMNGTLYACDLVAGFPGRLRCTGVPQAGGTQVLVTVCAPSGTSSLSPDALLPAAVDLPQPVDPPLLVAEPQDYALALPADLNLRPPSNWLPGTIGPAQAVTCPGGYTLDGATGKCTWSGGGACPAGWSALAEGAGCAPDEPSFCPEGTQFDAELNGCVPSGETCPGGYTLTARQTCEPGSAETQGLCPQGYRYASDAHCCLPQTVDNYGCPQDYIYDTQLQRCLPTQDGCAWGSAYDPYEGCIGAGVPAEGYPDNQDCPPGTTLAADGATCQPASTRAQTVCATGSYRDPQSGACLPYHPEDDKDCPEGSQYDWASLTCVQLEADGCAPGSFFDSAGGQCRPKSGPGSPCPTGYGYQVGSQCCVALPGSGNSACPGSTTDEVIAGNFLQADYPTAPYDSAFNPYDGLCQPGETGQCPTGYALNDQGVCAKLAETGCLPGSTLDPVDNLCRPDDGRTCPAGSFHDTSRNACIPLQGEDDPRAQCAGNQYFDSQLGYCVSRTSTCCGQGYAYDAATGSCTVGTETQMPACYSFYASVPPCDGPCLYPEVYDPVNNLCLPPADPTPVVGCGDLTTRVDCEASPLRCEWNNSEKDCYQLPGEAP
ncbi:MAG: SUMF1/EgtB/PvdO family nonheme iron enzyme [Anaerolineae bacterium]|nr:SUMF1/EgtB/PvdO family nonheme iron enzyme [Anaerolineae bacterium]